MMHGGGKSGSAIVAEKPTNKAEPSATEPVEPRAEAKGNARQSRTGRMPSRGTVEQGLERIRRTAREQRFAVTHPRWEPYAGKPHVRLCAGGAQQ